VKEGFVIFLVFNLVNLEAITVESVNANYDSLHGHGNEEL